MKLKVIEINGAWYAFNQEARRLLRYMELPPESGYLILALLVAHAAKYDIKIERVAYRNLKEISLEVTNG
jgi:hypothetical protein